MVECEALLSHVIDLSNAKAKYAVCFAEFLEASYLKRIANLCVPLEFSWCWTDRGGHIRGIVSVIGLQNDDARHTQRQEALLETPVVAGWLAFAQWARNSDGVWEK